MRVPAAASSWHPLLLLLLPQCPRSRSLRGEYCASPLARADALEVLGVRSEAVDVHLRHGQRQGSIARCWLGAQAATRLRRAKQRPIVPLTTTVFCMAVETTVPLTSCTARTTTAGAREREATDAPLPARTFEPLNAELRSTDACILSCLASEREGALQHAFAMRPASPAPMLNGASLSAERCALSVPPIHTHTHTMASFRAALLLVALTCAACVHQASAGGYGKDRHLKRVIQAEERCVQGPRVCAVLVARTAPAHAPPKRACGAAAGLLLSCAQINRYHPSWKPAPLLKDEQLPTDFSCERRAADAPAPPPRVAAGLCDASTALRPGATRL